MYVYYMYVVYTQNWKNKGFLHIRSKYLLYIVLSITVLQEM